MKKLSLVLFSVSIAFAATARDLYSPEEHPVTPVQIAFADPLEIPQANWNVYGLRYNIFFAQSFKVIGLDLGLVGRCRDTFIGAAFETANWVEGDAVGAQFGAAGNVVAGNATGFQLAGVVNYNRGLFTGMQIAPINNDGTFLGLQLGAVNWDKSICIGCQIGAVNADLNEFHGVSLGAVNWTGRLQGCQIGAVNVVSEFGNGCQIGIFNAAPKFQGLQIGLLNVIGSGELPILPFVNGSF